MKEVEEGREEPKDIGKSEEQEGERKPCVLRFSDR